MHVNHTNLVPLPHSYLYEKECQYSLVLVHGVTYDIDRVTSAEIFSYLLILPSISHKEIEESLRDRYIAFAPRYIFIPTYLTTPIDT
ncbi:MAG: hypothetical protein REV35_00350 [Burkholderia sp.]|nr:hypothetical protein [Burkholderia sp.]